MKRITYFMTIILGMVFLVGGVNADTYKEDSGWTGSSTGAFGKFVDELKASYEGYTFNKSTGKFSTTGKSYTEATNSSSLNTLVYYSVSSDGKTLYAYIPNWENNAAILSDYNFPAYQCSDVYKVEKQSIKTSESGDNTGDNTGDDDPIYDPDDEDNNGNGSSTNGNSSGSSDYTKEQTSDNPNTGVSPFLALPLVLGGGIALVLRKKRIFG